MTPIAKRLVCLIGAFFAFVFAGRAETVSLIADLNQEPELGGAQPAEMVEVNGSLYFVATLPGGISELWKSDGTSEGTSKVKTFWASDPSVNPSNAAGLVNVNGTLFFRAGNSTSGRELWKSDGTPEGTVMVKDIVSGTGSSHASNLVNVAGTLFFCTADNELWRSDGTEQGTRRVRSFPEATSSSADRIQSLTAVGGTLYFRAYDRMHGAELWKSDGSTDGTVMVKDIEPLFDRSSNPSELVGVGSTLYFSATTGLYGTELWKSDGTADGTVLVKDMVAGAGSSLPYYLTDVNGVLFFYAQDGVSGVKLWTTNGTAEGTTAISTVLPQFGGERWKPVNVNGTLFFQNGNGVSGPELWKSNGTAEGTVLVADIVPGPSGSDPSHLVEVNGMVFFQAYSAHAGVQLWRSDGTAAGTIRLRDLWVTQDNSSKEPRFVSAMEKLFFRSDDGISGVELFKSDGSPEGTVLVKNIVAGTASSNPRAWATLNGLLFVAAGNGLDEHPALWTSDGTTRGTVSLKDVLLREQGTPGAEFAIVNGTIFFRGFDPINGFGLWKSDGTDEGTVRVKAIAPDRAFFSPNLVNVNGVLFFTAYDSISGDELWKSDGTPEGTVMVKDILAGSHSSSPSDLVDVNGTLFFRAGDDESGDELWKSDGTPEGTTLVKDITSGRFGASPSHLVSVNGILYFAAENDASGRELWRSDGSPEGTVMVRDIAQGFRDSNPSGLAAAGGTLYFTADDGSSGYELWKSDGTAEGTVRVKDIKAGYDGSYPSNLVNVNGVLFFTVPGNNASVALWRSDGTAEGTVKLIDGLKGAGDGQPSNLTNVNGSLFFTMDDGVSGIELWKSDGTPEGTILALDLVPGAVGSNPVGLMPDGDHLYVSAQVPGIGVELVRVSTADVSAAPVITDGLASGVTTTAATIDVTASANQLTTAVRVEYGTSASLGATTPAHVINGPGVQNLLIKLSGLTKNTTYYYRTVAVNEKGSSHGEVRTFRLDAAAPTVESMFQPTTISSYATTLVEVSPHGASTNVWIEYGTDSHLSFSTARQHIDRGGVQSLLFTLSDLAPYRVYSYRVIAANSEGTTISNVSSFTSAPGRPLAISGIASAVTGTTANVSATVIANSPKTNVRIRYTSQGGAMLQTVAQIISGTDPQALTFSLSGLLSGTEYQYQVVASNSAGAGESQALAFATPPEAPSVVGASTLAVHLDSAELAAKVSPNGATTNVRIEYGITASFGQNSAVQTLGGAVAKALSFTLSGLEPSTPYYYRVVATNSQGSSHGSIGTFTTSHMASGVAYSGYGVPGSGEPAGPPRGSIFKDFGMPALSDSRALASRVTVTDYRKSLKGIYLRQDAGPASIIALQDGLAPGGGGGQFRSFLDPLLAPGGAVGFGAKVQGEGITSANDQGFWSTALGNNVLQPLLLEGGELPTIASGVRLKAFPRVSLQDGELLALVTLATGRGGVTPQNDTALLRLRSSGTEVLVREGEVLAVDGVPASRVERISALAPAPGSPGHGRWHAAGGKGVARLKLANKEEVVVRWAAEGDLVPVFSTRSELTEIGAGAKWQKLGRPSMGADGFGVAVSGQLKVGAGGVTKTDNAVVVYRAEDAPAQVVAREGMNAPGVVGANFASFSDPVVGAGRELAFVAELQGAGIGSANQSGLWWGTAGGELALVAQLGGLSTDKFGAEVPGRHWESIVSFALPGGAGAGPIFVARVNGTGVNPGNNLGLWAVDSRGRLRELVRTGTSPYGSEGAILRKFRVLSAVSGSFGASRSFNAARSVAIQAVDISNRQTLIRIDLP